MRFRFRFGKSGKLGRLTPEHEDVLKRLEAGELGDQEAAAALGGHVKTWKWSFGTDADEPTATAHAEEPTDEAAADDPAKALVEQIARQVDAEQ